MFNNYYQGKRVFLTGHTGFKGSWLAMWLNKLGAEVYGYSLEPYTKDDHFNVANIEQCLKKSTIGDIRDKEKFSSAIKEADPQVILHLAAQPLVRESYVDPVFNYETNINGVLNLLESARELKGLEVLLNVTTDKCYENNETVYDYKETDPMGGHDPYSSSKACSEIITSAYRRSFFHDTNVMICSARAGNVIGGGDWAKDRIMTDTFNCLSKNQPIAVRNPVATRPWQHVLEPLSGYLWLAAQRAKGNWREFASGWNFGPETGEGHTVKEVVEKAIHYYKAGSWEDKSDPNALHEAKLLSLDITKAKEKLEWLPTLDFDQSIRLTTSWYKLFFQDKEKTTGYSQEQLDEYISIAKNKNQKWI